MITTDQVHMRLTYASLAQTAESQPQIISKKSFQKSCDWAKIHLRLMTGRPGIVFLYFIYSIKSQFSGDFHLSHTCSMSLVHGMSQYTFHKFHIHHPHTFHSDTQNVHNILLLRLVSLQFHTVWGSYVMMIYSLIQLVFSFSRIHCLCFPPTSKWWCSHILHTIKSLHYSPTVIPDVSVCSLW